MKTILIGNGKDFFDISDLVSQLLEYWKIEGYERTEQEAIHAFMLLDNCYLIGKGSTYAEAVEDLLS